MASFQPNISSSFRTTRSSNPIRFGFSRSAEAPSTIDRDVKGSTGTGRPRASSDVTMGFKGESSVDDATSLTQSVENLAVMSFTGSVSGYDRGDPEPTQNENGEHMASRDTYCRVPQAQDVETRFSQRYLRWRLDEEIMLRLERIMGSLRPDQYDSIYNLLQTINVNGLAANTSIKAPALVPTQDSLTANGPPVDTNQAFYFPESHPLYESFYPSSESEDCFTPPSPTLSQADSSSSDSCCYAPTEAVFFSQECYDQILTPPDSVDDESVATAVQDVIQRFESSGVVPASPTLFATSDEAPASPKQKRKRDTDDHPTALARSTCAPGHHFFGAGGKRLRRAYRSRN
ncbi:hypothetical protein K491DRAFT_676802 [Lophiostoma macrostomum CBS 122681]|uniref:Uncharacterized protein n=1 Tax=Lophiostoma macrostomum CBS 122681 TaxID=1314788 RepID=A0A6A6TDU3_9PLEO|nr:hypothetical protein K491DRAFT_676802 [Lophiostoma macrostomum CBS 122681]